MKTQRKKRKIGFSFLNRKAEREKQKKSLQQKARAAVKVNRK